VTDDPRPPRLGRALLRLRPLGSRRAEIDADLREVFLGRVARDGRRRAATRYVFDVLSLWRWNPSGSSWARDAIRDLSHAVRLFRRSPGPVAVTVAGLSIAIAVSTSIFTFLNAAVFRGIGVSDPASTVRVLRTQKDLVTSNWTFAEYLALRESSPRTSIEAVLRDDARFSAEPVSPNDGAGQTVQITFIGGGFLAAFGPQPALGRILAPPDDAIGAEPVVVISHGFWTRRLGADPAIAGRRIWLNGRPVTVVGVAARLFTGFSDQAPAFWVPFTSYHVLYSGSPLSRTSQAGVNLYARLPKAASSQQTEGELSAIAAALGRDRQASERTTGVRLEPAGSRFTRPSEVRMVALVAAMVLTVMGLVLVLACVNVANLQLASALARHREIGVRLALGASRGRLVRQLLTESLSLGLGAGAAGFVLTGWILPAIATVVRAPATMDIAPDLRVYTFLALISLASGIGAGLAPARHGTGGDLMTPLKGEGGRAESPRSGRLRAMLVGVQAAASVVLLIFAALLTRAALRSTHVDVGFDAYRLVTIEPAFGRERYDESESRAYWRQALERIRTLPDARAAALADYPPYGGSAAMVNLKREGRLYTTYVTRTDADYFSTISLRVLRGRTYTAAEVAANAPVAVISEAMAREFWPGVEVLGQTLERFDGNAQVTVIGIVSNAITARLRDVASAALYRPLTSWRGARVVIRTGGPPEATVPSIRGVLQPLDPDVRLDINLVATGLQRQLDEPRILASLAGALAAFALGLAIVGIYGVTSFVVGQRTREIGLRIAIGATTADLMRLLLVETLRPVMIGLGGGAIVALILTRIFGGILYGVGSQDPLAVSGAILVLAVAAGTAVYIPTRRAARIDPAHVLRQS
jgi:predicted permease